MQEVPLCEWGGADPPEVQLLESLLGAAGYKRETKAESHCGFICIYLHNRVRQRCCSLDTFQVGPAAAVVLQLAAQQAGEATAAGDAAAPAAKPWYQQHQRRQQAWQEEEMQQVQQSGVQPIRLSFGDGPQCLPTTGGGSSLLSSQVKGLHEAQRARPSEGDGAQPTRLCLAGFHLEPFDERAQTRLRQLKALLSAAADHRTTHLLAAGDANMRNRETEAALDLGGLQVHHVLKPALAGPAGAAQLQSQTTGSYIALQQRYCNWHYKLCTAPSHQQALFPAE